MKSIKVYLQYPWKLPDSSYYKNMLEYLPRAVDFINYKKSSKKKIEVIGSSKKFEQIRVFKNFIRKILGILHLPNLTFTFNRDFDLIHCAHCLSLTKKPWVVDTEVYDRLSSSGGNVSDKGLGKWIIKNRLESPYCKQIICWSEDCKKSFEDAFPGNKKILDKLTILPFALPFPKLKKIHHKKIRLLFVARWFDAKGGRQTLEVFDRLTKKYPNIECIFICPTTKEFRDSYSGNKQIKIMDLVPQDRLFKDIYPSCDIFFYPGFGDSYGFAIPEALAYGLPIITSDSFAKKELVQEGKTGFLVKQPKSWKDYSCMDEKMLQDYVNAASKLIENKKLRNKMSKQARKRAKEFHSIEKRNKKLREIYEKALSKI